MGFPDFCHKPELLYINSFIFATQCHRFETLYSSGKIIQDCNIKGLHSSEPVQRNRLEYLSLWQKLSSKTSEHSEPGKLLTDYHISYLKVNLL